MYVQGAIDLAFLSIKKENDNTVFFNQTVVKIIYLHKLVLQAPLSSPHYETNSKSGNYSCVFLFYYYYFFFCFDMFNMPHF